MPPELTLHQLCSVQGNCFPAADLANLRTGFHPGRALETHPAQSLACRPPVWFDHNEAEQRFFFGGKLPADFPPEYAFPAAYVAAFPHARLAGSSYIVIAGDNRVLTDSYSGDQVLQADGRFRKQVLQVDLDGRRESLPFVLYRAPDRRMSIPDACLLPTHYWHFNYHHWLVECLPRLRLALETAELADCPVIVPAELTPFQRDSLAMLGLGPERLLAFDGGDWDVELLLFPSIGTFSPPELEWVRERVMAGASVGGGMGADADSPGDDSTLHPDAPMDAPTHTADSPSGPSTRLYISRGDATQRRLANEDEIVGVLESLGFEVLTLSEMPLAEQVARFARAEVIIGPHGSGLTNLLFAPRRARILELMPHDRVNHCFWLMTNVLGQPYTFLSGRVVSANRDFMIPAERLRAMVEAVTQSVAR